MQFVLIAFIVVVIGIPLFFLFQSHVQPTNSLPQDDLERIYAELKKAIVVTSVYTQETKYRHLYHRLDDLLSKIIERHQHFVLDVEAKYDRVTISNLFVNQEHHTSEGMQYHLLHGKNNLSVDTVEPDLLLSLPKYMTELQFKVASLIPTLLLRFKCSLVPEGEGLLPPSPSGRGNEGEGRMCHELRKDQ